MARVDTNLSLADLSEFLKVSSSKLGVSGSRVNPLKVRQILERRGYRYPQKVVSFQMLKGGVAKTTSALQFGFRASMYGARVLMIDLDQQSNLTFALGADGESRPVWIDVVEKKIKIQEAIVAIHPGLDLIPSSLNNSVLDRVLLQSHRNWSLSVKAPLKEIRDQYDLVIIDTAPSLSMINTAVTIASDQVVLPIQPDRFSMMGLEKHLEDLAELEREFDLELEKKILFTRFDGRESMSHQILTECLEKHEDSLMKNYVRSSSDLKNSIGTGKSIFSSKGAAKEDYDLVTRELLGFQ